MLVNITLAYFLNHTLGSAKPGIYASSRRCGRPSLSSADAGMRDGRSAAVEGDRAHPIILMPLLLLYMPIPPPGWLDDM